MITQQTLNEIRTLLTLGHKLALREIEQRASAVWPNASALQIAVLRHLDVQARTMSELSARPDDYDALQRSLDAMGAAKAGKLNKLLRELVGGMQTEDGQMERMLENARDRAALREGQRPA